MVSDGLIDSQCSGYFLRPQFVPATVQTISSCATTAAALTSRTPATGSSTVQIAPTKTSAQTVRAPCHYPTPPPQRFSQRDELEMPAKLNRRVTFRWFQSTATGSRWPTRPICRAFVGPEPRRSGMRMTLGHKRPWTDLRTVARLCKAPVKRRLRSIQVCFKGVLFVCLFNFGQTNKYMIYELLYTDRKDQKTQSRCTQYTQKVPGPFINTPLFRILFYISE